MLLADPPAVSSPEQPTAQASPGAPAEQQPAPARTCAHCGEALQGDQDWCLKCGAGAPGSLGGKSWRAPTTLILTVVALVAGAAVAGAAALGRHHAPPVVTVQTVAQTPPASTVPVTPTTSTPGSTPGFSTTTPGLSTPTTRIPKIPGTSGSSLPHTTAKVPKIPFFNSTPKSSGTTTQPTASTPKETTTPSTGTTGSGTETETGSGSTGTTTQPTPIVLDTDAATTYNPYGYPEANFGDPSLAIDGDTTTAWTAQLDPAVAPRMAEGLVLDLKTPHRVGNLEVHTTTPGTIVEVYGANGHTLPSSITDPAWKQLSAPHALKKTAHLKLHAGQKTYRFVLLWLTKAPAASVGTAQAPGHVAVSELALFPPASS